MNKDFVSARSLGVLEVRKWGRQHSRDPEPWESSQTNREPRRVTAGTQVGPDRPGTRFHLERWGLRQQHRTPGLRCSLCLRGLLRQPLTAAAGSARHAPCAPGKWHRSASNVKPGFAAAPAEPGAVPVPLGRAQCAFPQAAPPFPRLCEGSTLATTRLTGRPRAQGHTAAVQTASPAAWLPSRWTCGTAALPGIY